MNIKKTSILILFGLGTCFSEIQYGMGWDDGLSFRLFLNSGYGLGLSFFPELKSDDRLLRTDIPWDTSSTFMGSETFSTSIQFDFFKSIYEGNGLKLEPYLKAGYTYIENEQFLSDSKNSFLMEKEVYSSEIGIGINKKISNKMIIGTRVGFLGKYEFVRDPLSSLDVTENYYFSLGEMNVHHSFKIWILL